MSFSQVIGHQEVLRLLQQAIRQSEVAHSYLFYGPEGVGKFTVALQFAKAVNCEHNQTDACDHCLTCRRIEHHNHPEVRILQPGSAMGEKVAIDQVRELWQDVKRPPRMARRKLYILPNAEKMSPPTYHALLKTLEEPPPYVTLLLLVPELTYMLPTVLSRCQKIRFSPVEEELLTQWLCKKGFDQEKARQIARLSGGRPGLALRLAQNEALFASRKELISLLNEVARQPDPRFALRWAERFYKLAQQHIDKNSQEEASETNEADLGIRNERSALLFLLEMQTSILRDLFLLQNNTPPENISNLDLLPDLEGLASLLNPSAFQRSLYYFLRAPFYLRSYVQPRLVLEVAYLRLAHAFQR